MSALSRIRRHSQQGDEGVALITVIGILFMVTALLLTALAVAMNNLKPTREDQDAKAAIAAAQAGLDDYQSRLTNSANYGTLDEDATNPAMNGGATIPGSVNGATYKYKVLQTSVQSPDGNVKVEATGTVKGESRTFVATFSPLGFLDYVYLTDLEDMSVTYSGKTDTACTLHWWASPVRRANNNTLCREIGFAPGDTLSGKVHTNDTPMLNGQGVKFNDVVSGGVTLAEGGATTNTTPNGVACAANNCYRDSGQWPSSYPYNASTFSGKYLLKHSGVINIPTGNEQLKEVAKASGCYFTGATHIGFNGTSMKVFSPATTDSTCGFNASNRNTTQTIPVPDREVIYVDGTTTCTQASQTNAAQLTQVTGQAGTSYPLATEETTKVSNVANDVRARYNPVSGGGSTPSNGTAYSCFDGTAYVGGTLDGQITIGTSQDIIVTHDLVYANKTNTSNDVLGLIPTHTVWVYHPVRGLAGAGAGGVNLDTTPVREINAAVLTLNDSFFVQNYDTGPSMSNLKVVGSLAQKYRGTVGSGNPPTNTGYIKDYNYDVRFKNGIKPPHFLAPIDSPWTIDKVEEK